MTPLYEEFKDYSEEELKHLRQIADALIEKMHEKKKNYKIYDAEPISMVNEKLLYHRLLSHFQDQTSLLLEEFNQLLEQSSTKVIPNPDLIYPCPECGKLDLYVGADYDSIRCADCGFEFKAKGQAPAKDLWNEFQVWLVKEGYLNK